MFHPIRSLTLAVLTAAGFSLGCAHREHRSVYIHERGPEARPADPQPTEQERVVEEGEWHMTSPGTMVVEPD